MDTSAYYTDKKNTFMVTFRALVFTNFDSWFL